MKATYTETELAAMRKEYTESQVQNFIANKALSVKKIPELEKLAGITANRKMPLYKQREILTNHIIKHGANND